MDNQILGIRVISITLHSQRDSFLNLSLAPSSSKVNLVRKEVVTKGGLQCS